MINKDEKEFEELISDKKNLIFEGFVLCANNNGNVDYSMYIKLSEIIGIIHNSENSCTFFTKNNYYQTWMLSHDLIFEISKSKKSVSS